MRPALGCWWQADRHDVKRPLSVTTQALRDEDGGPAVFLGLPVNTNWVTMAPADARRTAAILLNAADEAEREWGDAE